MALIILWALILIRQFTNPKWGYNPLKERYEGNSRIQLKGKESRVWSQVGLKEDSSKVVSLEIS